MARLISVACQASSWLTDLVAGELFGGSVAVDGAIIYFQINDAHSFDRLKAVVDAINKNTFPWEDVQAQRSYFDGSLPDELIARLEKTRSLCDFLECSREKESIGCVATDPYAYPVDVGALHTLIELFGHKVS